MATVFFSYSHKDESLRNQLETHLSMLKNQGLIQAWHDRQILAGSNIDNSISEPLDAADVILLLVSSDFLASTYCYSKEMARAMERQAEGTAQVIPVILRDCDWHAAPFGKLLAVPTDGRAITLWPNIDQAFTDVARQIRKALEGNTALIPSPVMAVGQGRPNSHGVPNADELPRSSNLRVTKEFDEQEKSEFLKSTFAYVGRFFQGSIQALQARHPEITCEFEQIDSRCFAAVAYRDGRSISECSIRTDGLSSRNSSIAYSNNAAVRSNSYNEMLTVEADKQSLHLKALMAMRGNIREEALSQQGAAEYLWGMFIEPLQR